jgi:hypothetical protein
MSVISYLLYLSSQAVHTAGRGDEERASSHAVDYTGSTDRHDQAEEGVTDLELDKRVREWATN